MKSSRLCFKIGIFCKTTITLHFQLFNFIIILQPDKIVNFSQCRLSTARICSATNQYNGQQWNLSRLVGQWSSRRRSYWCLASKRSRRAKNDTRASTLDTFHVGKYVILYSSRRLARRHR